MQLRRLLLGAALALAATAPPAHAAGDRVVATTARPTPLAAGGGLVLYSAWDGSSYRLTELGSGPLPIAGAAHPFRADIGRGADDQQVAVYRRCTGDQTGCDLYLYDFQTRQERALDAANSTNDEMAGAIWRDRLVFGRVYRHTGKIPKGVLYERSLAHPGRRSKRLATQRAYTVDVRGTRVPFADVREWSREPWLAHTSRRGVDRLTRVPGSGAAVDFLHAMNPTAYGSSIYWLFVRSGESNMSVLHRYNRTKHRDERVAATIPAAASGFAWDAGGAYYAVPTHPATDCSVPDHDCPTEIHRVRGLAFEKAPPIELH
jgi:hypothetical protein